jgi:GT2 family glycosyltransferase
MANSINQFPVRMLAVIVLYKMQPNESAAFKTLQAATSSLQSGQAEIKILLYDNTPGGQAAGVLPDGVQYKANPENGALSAACNYALEVAHKEGFEWLLTLNQDTTLPNDFLCKLCDAAMFVAPMHDVAGIVPSIKSNGRVVSPFTLMKYWTFMGHFPDGFIGIPSKDVYAANSASMIKVSALKAIGGFDPRFPLDLIDFDVNYRLHRQNLRFLVAGNIHVGLELSTDDLKRRSSPGRYEDYLRAEEGFCDEYLGTIVSIVVVLKLIYRMGYKLWRSGGSFPYFKVAFRFLCRRLFYSRKHRIELWKQSIRQRLAV